MAGRGSSNDRSCHRVGSQSFTVQLFTIHWSSSRSNTVRLLKRSPKVRIRQLHSPEAVSLPQLLSSTLSGQYPTALIACSSVIPSVNRRLDGPQLIRVFASVGEV